LPSFQAVLIIKRAENYGRLELAAKVSIIRIPVFAFIYLFGRK